jgi:bifunctional non-homologous end joining protein LigD
VDAMRGRSSAWYRVRVNLEHVPEEKRPPQEALESDYDPWAGQQFSEEEIAAWKASQRAKSKARREAKKS